MGLRHCTALVVAMLVAASPLAADPPPFADGQWDPALLDRLAEGPALLPADAVFDLPLPPDAAAMERDLRELGRLAKEARTPEALAAIVDENRPDANVPDLFKGNGLLPPPESAAGLWGWLRVVEAETEWFVLREKRAHAWPRPHTWDPSLVPTIPVPPHPSFPSGHSAQAHAVAVALALASPTCGPQAAEAAWGIATRREVAGVHTRSDTEAGRALGEAVVAALAEHPTGAVLLQMAQDTDWTCSD
jgi:PAP2 superfamily